MHQTSAFTTEQHHQVELLNTYQRMYMCLEVKQHSVIWQKPSCLPHSQCPSMRAWLYLTSALQRPWSSGQKVSGPLWGRTSWKVLKLQWANLVGGRDNPHGSCLFLLPCSCCGWFYTYATPKDPTLRPQREIHSFELKLEPSELCIK